MFIVVITEKGGEQRRLDFDKPEVTIGRVQGNDIILPKGNVSKRHSRIVLKDSKFIIVDLKSTNGTYVNGRKITSPLVIKQTDKIYIGDFILNVEEGAMERPTSAPGTSGSETTGKKPPPPLPRRKSSLNVTALGEEPSFSDASMSQPLVERPPVVPPHASPHRAEPSINSRPPVRNPIGPDPIDSSIEAGVSPPNPTHLDLVAVPSASDLKTSTKTPSGTGGRPKSSIGAMPPATSIADPRRLKNMELQKEVHKRLIGYIDLRRMDFEQLVDEVLWEKTENAICEIVETMYGEGALPAFVSQDDLIRDVLNEALGLGPLEELLADDTITEVMVNRADQIYIEREGTLELANHCFSSDEAVIRVIERLVAPLGQRIDELTPIVDVRLKDGIRINAIIPPLVLKGPTLTISKSRGGRFSGEQLVRMQTLSRPMLDFLQVCVSARKNIVISGGVGAGKTTLLSAICSLIPMHERIITIEEIAELQLKHEHWVQLESRLPDIEGKGEVTSRDLLRNALRMRPDRIIVGDCHGFEVLKLLQTLAAGYEGALTTIYANSPWETLSRLETMALLAGRDMSTRAIRKQVASTFDIIVFQLRFADNSRRVTRICETAGIEGDTIALKDIFVFEQEGFDESGRIRGRFLPVGYIPRFYEDLHRQGIPVDRGIFSP